jgi:hypothetical protein
MNRARADVASNRSSPNQNANPVVEGHVMATIQSAEYRDIPGAPGYRIGSDGSVWSCWRPTWAGAVADSHWKQLSPGTMRKRGGYKYVVLRRFGRRESITVHRLVLFAFVGPPPEGHICRHLDGDPANNRLSNLCWGTPLDNSADRKDHGRLVRGGQSPSAKLTILQVEEIRNRYDIGGITQRQLATAYGVDQSLISRIMRRSRWRHAY